MPEQQTKSPQKKRVDPYNVAVWKAAFDDVIEHYHKLKSAGGNEIKGLDYSKTGEAGNTANILRVGPSDFICDVELAARKALPDSLYSRFVECYVECVEEPDTQDRDIDNIRLRAGRSFYEKHIAPVSNYFRPKPIDRGRNKK